VFVLVDNVANPLEGLPKTINRVTMFGHWACGYNYRHKKTTTVWIPL